MAELRFIPASLADLTFIFENVRKENLTELEVFDDLGLDDAIGQSIERSSEAFVAVIDGEPVCAFGVVDSGRPGTGRPWMVGTSNIDRHGIAFLRASKQVIADIMVRWPHLENWADARNLRGLRWLRFMGFTIHPAVPVGEKGLPFHRFEKGVLDVYGA